MTLPDNEPRKSTKATEQKWRTALILGCGGVTFTYAMAQSAGKAYGRFENQAELGRLGGEIYACDEKLHHRLGQQERFGVQTQKAQLQASVQQLEADRDPYNSTWAGCTGVLAGLGFAYVLGKHIYSQEIQDFKDNFSLAKCAETLKQVFTPLPQ